MKKSGKNKVNELITKSTHIAKNAKMGGESGCSANVAQKASYCEPGQKKGK